jgi:cell pole-organizing protein PopZ
MNSMQSKHSGMSVEEIIRSIRGVIDNHNDGKKTTENIAAREDVLELTEILGNTKVDSDIMSDLSSKQESKERLISDSSARDTTDVLKQFATTAKRVVQDHERKSHTVEELVINMMRPQLKKWLDENLPKLVRELVEKEIRRLIPDDDKE